MVAKRKKAAPATTFEVEECSFTLPATYAEIAEFYRQNQYCLIKGVNRHGRGGGKKDRDASMLRTLQRLYGDASAMVDKTYCIGTYSPQLLTCPSHMTTSTTTIQPIFF